MAHGGGRFRNMQADFEFRGDPFQVVYADGEFRFERRTVGPGGEDIVDRMDNDGTSRLVDGTPVTLTPAETASVETAVNSVVYFAFLPWRLQDPAVRLRDLGTAPLGGVAYRKIEVTFEADGGGRDWEDRFVYWFHPETGTLDYLAYRFHTGEGGTRFRRAMNRREEGGLLVQDYENYTATRDLDDVADFDELYEAGELRRVSVVELDRLRITTPSR
jgi:hypothetical protein